MKIEFMGGPLDGETRDYIRPPSTLFVPFRAVRAQVTRDPVSQPEPVMPEVYVDVYRRCSNGHYHHVEEVVQ